MKLCRRDSCIFRPQGTFRIDNEHPASNISKPVRTTSPYRRNTRHDRWFQSRKTVFSANSHKQRLRTFCRVRTSFCTHEAMYSIRWRRNPQPFRIDWVYRICRRCSPARTFLKPATSDRRRIRRQLRPIVRTGYDKRFGIVENKHTVSRLRRRKRQETD